MPVSPLASEKEQFAGLVRQRRIATFLLLLMASVFVATKLVPHPGFWTGLIQAGAEAALVGGLADWFAVTALFRKPFGLPIPHTAIIPRNKDRLGQGLARFVERHFLDPDLVRERLRGIDFAGRAGAWLARPENADRLANRAAASVPHAMHLLQDREVQEFFRRTLSRQIEQVNLAPIVARILQILSESDQHQVLFDKTLVIARRFVERHQERIYELVSEKSSWWVPSTVDRKIAERIVTGVIELLGELSEPEHEARQGFDTALSELIRNLESSEEYHARVDELKRELMRNPSVQVYLGSVWDQLRNIITSDLASPSSRLRLGLSLALQSVAVNLPKDERMRQRVNRRIETLFMEFVVPWRTDIGDFIKDVVHSWDTQTVSGRIELAVGRDLQFIRINGTLVGALVGCGLFLLSDLLF